MPFGQLLIGPPGTGKSTYAAGLHQFLSAIGRRPAIVNLDPANDSLPYPCALDIRDYVTLEDVMREEGLGPNGGVMFAFEEFDIVNTPTPKRDVGGSSGEGADTIRRQQGQEKQEGNIYDDDDGGGGGGGVGGWEWLEEGLTALGKDVYVIFDCPGQVEVWTHHESLKRVIRRLERRMGYRLVAVHLTDSYCLTQPSLYISALLLCLRSMLQLDLPHLNVLTKIDKLASYGPLPFNLDFYTEVQDLSYLLPHLTSEGKNPNGSSSSPTSTTQRPTMFRHSKFEALNNAVVELIEDFGLVSFETLAVENKKSMMMLLQAVDRAGGYAFGSAEGANDTVWQVAMRQGGMEAMNIQDIQERWIDRKDEFDEMERLEAGEAEKARDEMAAGGEGGEGGSLEMTVHDIDDFDDPDGGGGMNRPGQSCVHGSGRGAVKVIRKP